MSTSPGMSISAAYLAAREYLEAGLSIFPALPRGKKPAPYLLEQTSTGNDDEWGPFRTKRASIAQVTSWFAASPNANICIVGGEISGRLLIFDVDDRPFSEWIERTCPHFLQRTWTVRTGSGKLHIYVRASTGSIKSSVFNHDGVHLADLRSEGNYVVAPPSAHPDGGFYTTIFGGPFEIAVSDDPAIGFRRLTDRYLSERNGGTVIDLSTRKPVEPPPPVVTSPAPSGMEEILLLAESRGVPDRFQRLLRLGAKAGEGGWDEFPSNSELDKALCVVLARRGFSDDEIVQVYNTTRAGEYTYKNVQRAGSHGADYLGRTIAAARQSIRTQADAGRRAIGENFSVDKAVRIQTMPPTYEMVLVNNDNSQQREKVSISGKALSSEYLFVEAVIQQSSRLVPTFHRKDAPFPEFRRRVVLMADLQDAPDETRGGYLKILIRDIVVGRLLDDDPPASLDDVRTGWRDAASGFAFVRGVRLISILGMQIRQMPGPDKVWEAVRALKGSYRTITLAGKSDLFWIIPLKEVGWTGPSIP